jgi:hypothetical protein
MRHSRECLACGVERTLSCRSKRNESRVMVNTRSACGIDELSARPSRGLRRNLSNVEPLRHDGMLRDGRCLLRSSRLGNPGRSRRCRRRLSHSCNPCCPNNDRDLESRFAHTTVSERQRGLGLCLGRALVGSGWSRCRNSCRPARGLLTPPSVIKLSARCQPTNFRSVRSYTSRHHSVATCRALLMKSSNNYRRSTASSNIG